jgi:hypothetical protein
MVSRLNILPIRLVAPSRDAHCPDPTWLNLRKAVRRLLVWNLVTTLSAVMVVGSMPKKAKVTLIRKPSPRIAASKITIIMM